MIKLTLNPFLEDLSEIELIILAKKECKYTADARTALLKKYQPYIYKLLLLYPYYIQEDLEILAYVGLIKAIEHFDSNKNVILITYAQFFIRKEITNYINNEMKIAKREISELILEESQFIEFENYENHKPLNKIQSEKSEIENKYDRNSIKTQISNFINELTQQEQLLISLIFFQGYRAVDAAEKLNIEKSRASQILNSIKQKGQKKLSYFKMKEK